MAGGLPKQAAEFHKIPYARIAIICAMWHRECVEAMAMRAHSELLALDVKPKNITTHYIPGSLELPFAAQTLFQNDSALDAIIAFGVVLKGETTHNEAVIQQVVQGFGLVSNAFGKPIINEVIGVNSIADAHKRAGNDELNKGLEAVFAVSELLYWQKGVSAHKPVIRGF